MTELLTLTMAAVKRAEKTDLEGVFKKYASVEKDEERYMTPQDFVCRYLKLVDPDCCQATVALLADVADTTKNKLISFSEFRTFETLLCTPDAVNQLAFKLFDLENRGTVSFDNFWKVLSETTICQSAPFDFNCPFIHQYFGKERNRRLDYFEFSQLLQSLPTEHARQLFRSRDDTNSGSIPALEFVKLMEVIRGFRMSDHVKDNLLFVAGGSPGRQVSYAYFKAFNQFLGNLDLLKTMVQHATHGDMEKRVTQEGLLREASKYPQVTPLQVSLLFELSDLEERTGDITMEDFLRLMPRPPTFTPATPTQTEKPEIQEGGSGLKRYLQPAYRFFLGAIAGATGATAVYPIDLVKTRLQNQRGTIPGEIMYKNSVDCFQKVVKAEGLLGLYRGLLPQLVGVAPEKAIKLATNDTVRDLLRSKKDGSLLLWQEVLAGGCAGASQVVFTNPLEIVKIRLQVAGEMAETVKVGASRVVKDLGLIGLYKGASACFLRDIPFSSIYFPTYAHMKTLTSDKNGRNGPLSLFCSGFIAGVPAAGLVTPADVIKTRLQVKARKGQTVYKNIWDCAVKINRKEGFHAFWKGAPARVMRSSPQFGFTLLTYELLQRLFTVDFGGKNLPVQGHPSYVPPSTPIDTLPFHFPDHIGGFRMANATFAGMESRFGLIFPRHTDAPRS